jgi:hypothetical protein
MAADGQARSRRKPIVTRVPVGAPGLAARASHPGSPPSRLLPGWVSTWRRWTGNALEADQVLSRSHS